LKKLSVLLPAPAAAVNGRLKLTRQGSGEGQ
jgi:hypothetical protein